MKLGHVQSQNMTKKRCRGHVGELTMSLTLRRPPEKTMALGGVATGNMKAKEQETVAGIIRYSGCTQILSPCRENSLTPYNKLSVINASSINIVLANVCMQKW